MPISKCISLNFRMLFKYGLKAQKSVWSILAKVQWAYKLQKKKNL